MKSCDVEAVFLRVAQKAIGMACVASEASVAGFLRLDFANERSVRQVTPESAREDLRVLVADCNWQIRIGKTRLLDGNSCGYGAFEQRVVRETVIGRRVRTFTLCVETRTFAIEFENGSCFELVGVPDADALYFTIKCGDEVQLYVGEPFSVELA